MRAAKMSPTFGRRASYQSETNEESEHMEYRTLGKSGLKVSTISLGCWAIGGPSWRDGGAVG